MITSLPQLVTAKTELGSYADNGGLYIASAVFTSIASSSTAVGLFKVSTKAAHSALYLTASQDARIQIYETPTITANGTTVTIYNMKRASSNTPLSTAFHTPTLSADGTLIYDFFLPGGSGNFSNGGTASFGGGLEFIFGPSLNYHFKFTNAGSSAATMGMSMSFYEV